MMRPIGLGEVCVTYGTVVGVGAALIEGAALGGARLLEKSEGITSKIAKAALAIIALASAVLMTGSGVLAISCAIGLCFPYSTTLQLIAVAAQAAILPVHYKAFQWAKLV